MIEIFKTEEGKTKKVSRFEENCWINLTRPTSEEIKELSERMNIPINFLADPLDINERARIEIDNGFALIVLRIPHFDKKNKEIPFITLPLGIIFNKDIFITLCSKQNEVISDFVKGRIKNFHTEKKDRFILQIFLKTAHWYLKYLKQINEKTTSFEKELHRSIENEALIKLLNIEKSLVFFTTSLRSNELMMERLQRTEIIKPNPGNEDLFEDVIIENRQAIEMANIYSKVLSGMMDAFASVISNNLNVVVKALTSITIILMIPTLVASIYGMNVRLPFEYSPYAFIYIVAISFVLSAIGVFIFIRRKWF